MIPRGNIQASFHQKHGYHGITRSQMDQIILRSAKMKWSTSYCHLLVTHPAALLKQTYCHRRACISLKLSAKDSGSGTRATSYSDNREAGLKPGSCVWTGVATWRSLLQGRSSQQPSQPLVYWCYNIIPLSLNITLMTRVKFYLF